MITDAEGDPITASLWSNVLHGTLTLNANGTFTYSPTKGFVGTDIFYYRPADAFLQGNVVQVTIQVTAPVAPPPPPGPPKPGLAGAMAPAALATARPHRRAKPRRRAAHRARTR